MLEHTMIDLESIVEVIVWQQLDIDDMHFRFKPNCSTTDAIFIFRQMQEKHHWQQNTIYAAFVDLEKAFDIVPCKVLWWSLRKLGVDDWVICVVKAILSNAQSSVQVNGSSKECRLV